MKFIARQPIFDRNLQVFGYELLFREGQHLDFAAITEPDVASRQTLDTSVILGLDRLCHGKRAFVNCTREGLVNGFVELLPPDQAIVEILENIPADPEVLEACQFLRKNKYTIALDDVTSTEEVARYGGLIDIVKVDFRETSEARQQELAEWLRQRGITPLAEKVETKAEFRRAMSIGFQLFQGFFFQRPEVMSTRDIPILSSNYLGILQAIQQPEIDFDLVENVVRAEPSLCYRLLRYINSPLLTFAQRVGSVRHALSLLGEREIKRWLLVAMAAVVGADKPSELLVWALTRARFCELVSEMSPANLEGSFLLGLMSAFPALLEMPLEDILERMPVSAELKDALLRPPQEDIIGISTAYEQGNWADCTHQGQSFGLNEDTISSCYVSAVTWAKSVAGTSSESL